MTARDEFSKPTRDALAKRAAFVCSNPDCRVVCVSPDPSTEEGVIFTGKAAHIHAAAPRGPRYLPSQTPDQRKHISNGVFLCSSCSVVIDQNTGAAHPAELLRSWKTQQDEFVHANLNRRSPRDLIHVDGEHSAAGSRHPGSLPLRNSAGVVDFDIQGVVTDSHTRCQCKAADPRVWAKAMIRCLNLDAGDRHNGRWPGDDA